MSERRLTLVVPGLWGARSPAVCADAVEGLRAGELARWLARGDTVAAVEGSLERVLCASFGIHAEANTDLPVAALTRLTDGGQADEAWYVRADPMHLRADRDTVVSLGQRGLGLTLAQAQALAAELQTLWAEDGVSVEARTPLRWYLRSDAPIRVRTHEPDAVLGRSILEAMPAGAQARDWRRRLNEAQMLLHGSAVNAEREARGAAVVNSVWLWGAGRLPARTPARWTQVWTNEPLGAGLARWAGVDCTTVAGTGAEWLEAAADGRHLVVLHGAAEPAHLLEVERWREFVDSFDEHWLQPLAAAMSAGKLDGAELHVGEKCALAVTPKALRRWWRRSGLRAWPEHC